MKHTILSNQTQQMASPNSLPPSNEAPQKTSTFEQIISPQKSEGVEPEKGSMLSEGIRMASLLTEVQEIDEACFQTVEILKTVDRLENGPRQCEILYTEEEQIDSSSPSRQVSAS